MYRAYQKKKSEPLFVKDFLGDNKTEFIEILRILTFGFYQDFYEVSKRSVANCQIQNNVSKNAISHFCRHMNYATSSKS